MKPLGLFAPLAALALGGCAAETWPAASYLWSGRGADAFADAVPAAARRADSEILYATDRERGADDEAGPTYGYGRSRALAYGVARADFDPPATWDEFVEASAALEDGPRLRPVVAKRRELARFFRGEADYGPDGRGGFRATDETLRREAELRERLGRELEARLAASGRRDVYVFVHGFNNGFDEVVLRLAALWSAAGRPGAALAYTWPAGTSILGYFYDRESGEFTVRHLKLVLEFLAASPAVERVHLVAHSRGTDVVSAALRELHLARAAQSVPTAASLKLATLVLAAPDLDAEIFDQRFLKEGVHTAAARTTIYFNRDDGAIGAAAFIFGSGRRLGGLRPEDLSPEARSELLRLTNVELVECAVRGRSGGHDYAFRDPSALSDLATLLRDGAPAGSAARPLTKTAEGFWRLDNDYLRPAALGPSSRPRRSDAVSP
jgi:esterase/lipase superfamily enzyme